MANRGRPTSASSMLDRLGAGPAAKERVLVIVANLTGAVPVAEACRRLALGRTQFWALRTAFLSAAIRTVEPRRRGRPSRVPDPEDRRVSGLQAEVARLKEALELSRVREEIAFVLPWTGRRQKRARRILRRRPAETRPGSPGG